MPELENGIASGCRICVDTEFMGGISDEESMMILTGEIDNTECISTRVFDFVEIAFNPLEQLD